MAHLFPLTKPHSLFPEMIRDIKIAKEEYYTFYKSERALLKIFLVLLHRDFIESTLVIGFLLWLEREGYTSYILGKVFISSLRLDVIDQVADEVVLCIKFLQNKDNTSIPQGSGESYNISQLQVFLDKKFLHLDQLYFNGDLIYHEVSCIANYVSEKVFDDILEQYGGLNQDFMPKYHKSHQYDHHQLMVSLGSGANGSNLVPQPIDLRKTIIIGKKKACLGGRAFKKYSQIVERERDDQRVPPDDRTIFLTFSKGYPLYENEITQYFTSMFGDFIESIHMQPVEGGNQPLFALVVVRCPSSVRAVIDKDGQHGKSKYIISGKHVWARKFVPRTPFRDTL